MSHLNNLLHSAGAAEKGAGELPQGIVVKCLSDASFFPNLKDIKVHRYIETVVRGIVLLQVTLLDSAVEKGAVCLDGSPAAYHFRPVHRFGANSWLVHLEGRAWCVNCINCLEKIKSDKGLRSFTLMKGKLVQLHGQRMLLTAMETFMAKGMHSDNEIYNGLAPPHPWKECKSNHTKCSESQIQILQDLRMQILDEVEGFVESSQYGLFIN